MDQGQALHKAMELVASTPTFVLATVDGQQRPQMRWMGGILQDPLRKRVLYMCCGAQSRKMAQIADNANAQLLFTAPNYECIVTLEGSATSVYDPNIKRMVWEKRPGAQKHFDSCESPDFAVIEFTTECIEVLCLNESHEPVRVSVCNG